MRKIIIEKHIMRFYVLYSLLILIFLPKAVGAQMTKVDSLTFYKMVKQPTMYIFFSHISDSLKNRIFINKYGGEWKGIDRRKYYNKFERNDTVFYEVDKSLSYRLKSQKPKDTINFSDINRYYFKPRLYPFESTTLVEVVNKNEVLLYDVAAYIKTSLDVEGKGKWFQNKKKDYKEGDIVTPRLPIFIPDMDSLMQLQISHNAKFPDGMGKVEYLYFNPNGKNTIPIEKGFYVNRSNFKDFEGWETNQSTPIPFYGKHQYKRDTIFRIGRFNCYIKLPGFSYKISKKEQPYLFYLAKPKIGWQSYIDPYVTESIRIRFPEFNYSEKTYFSSFLPDIEELYIVEDISKEEFMVHKVRARRNECINIIPDSWDLYQLYYKNFNLIGLKNN